MASWIDTDIEEAEGWKLSAPPEKLVSTVLGVLQVRIQRIFPCRSGSSLLCNTSRLNITGIGFSYAWPISYVLFSIQVSMVRDISPYFDRLLSLLPISSASRSLRILLYRALCACSSVQSVPKWNRVLESMLVTIYTSADVSTQISTLQVKNSYITVPYSMNIFKLPQHPYSPLLLSVLLKMYSALAEFTSQVFV